MSGRGLVILRRRKIVVCMAYADVRIMELKRDGMHYYRCSLTLWVGCLSGIGLWHGS